MGKDLSAYQVGAGQHRLALGNNLLPMLTAGIGDWRLEDAIARRIFIGHDVKIVAKDIRGIEELFARGQTHRSRVAGSVL